MLSSLPEQRGADILPEILLVVLRLRVHEILHLRIGGGGGRRFVSVSTKLNMIFQLRRHRHLRINTKLVSEHVTAFILLPRHIMQVHVTRHDSVPGVVVARAVQNVREHDLDLPLRAVRRVAAVESVVQLGKLWTKTHS